MAIELSQDIWSRIPIFNGLTCEECAFLGSICDKVEHQVGELVLEQGTRRPALWVLLEGKCDVVRNFATPDRPPESVVLATLEPYANFGEMSFFHDAPHSAHVRAATDVALLRIERRRFNELVEEHSAAACKLTLNTVHSLAERLRRMDQWIAELAAAGKLNNRVREWSQLREQLFDAWSL
jgi:CRP-like cAMP-binding protein